MPATAAICAPVTTPITPRSFSAALVSIERMRACGCGERRIAACRIPATGSRSSMKRPRPVRSGASSLRGTDLPTQPVAAALGVTARYHCESLGVGCRTVQCAEETRLQQRAFPGRQDERDLLGNDLDLREVRSGLRVDHFPQTLDAFAIHNQARLREAR